MNWCENHSKLNKAVNSGLFLPLEITKWYMNSKEMKCQEHAFKYVSITKYVITINYLGESRWGFKAKVRGLDSTLGNNWPTWKCSASNHQCHLNCTWEPSHLHKQFGGWRGAYGSWDKTKSLVHVKHAPHILELILQSLFHMLK